MSTTKKTKKRKASPQDDAQTESPELQAEVAAFASQLGLGSAGGTDHAFEDFAPQQARQQLGKAPGHRHPAAAAGGDADELDAEPVAAPVAKKRRGKPPGPAADVGQQADQPFVPPVSDAMAAAIREREWNAGIGPRPGDGKRSLLGKDSPVLWYEALTALPPLPPVPANTAPFSEAKVDELRQRGQALLEREAAVFGAELGRKNGQDARWLQQVRRSGTTSDKVAAITLLLQESAVANLKSLDQLVSWVARHKGGRGVVGQAMDAGREIFLTALLPDRKLRWLGQQLLAALPTGRDGERRLLLWTLEDALKQRYGAFVVALEEGSRDNLEYVKERALAAAAALLRAKPEAEAQLLGLLVNKLGDPSRKLASKAGYLLGNVLSEHPGMKAIVVAEVQRFLFRPGLQERARYYAVVFLNQLQLSHHPTHGGSELAKKLIDVYLTLFSLIMTGKVGHAASLQRAAEEKAEAAATSRKKGGKQKAGRQNGGRHKQHKHPPKKGAPGSAASPHLAEEMDARMLGALVAGVRRAFPFVDAAEVEAVIDKHSDALFRITHTAPLSVSLQVLALMLQLMGSRRAVSDRFYRALYAVVLSPEVSRTNKAPMFVSLVFKAMKADVSIKRVAAFAKRLLQVALHAPAPFAAGVLFLLSEVLKVKSALWTAVLQPQEAADEVEQFRDVADTDTAAAAQDVEQQQHRHFAADRSGAAAEAGDRAMGSAERPADEVDGSGAAVPGPQPSGERPWPAPGAYDMHKREPLYCGAETACWWEVVALTQHCHPSVVAMARSLAAGSSVVYDGDPLRDLALAAFLDKFVRRKAKVKARGGSVMQPLAKAAGDESAAAAAEPGTSAFAALAAADVKPDAVFFHKFYSAKEARAPAKRREAANGDEDDSDASDAEIDRVLDEEEDAGAEGIDEGGVAGNYDYSTLAAAFDESGSEDGGAGSDEEGGSGANSEDMNPFELAEPTTSEEEGGAGEEGSSDDGSDDTGSSGGNDIGGEEDMGDFASADLWAERIDALERGEGAGADDAADGDSEDEQPAQPRRRKRKGVSVPSAGEQRRQKRRGRNS